MQIPKYIMHTLCKRLVGYLEKHFYLFLSLIFVVAVIAMPYTALVGDYNDFLKWITEMKTQGLGYMYNFPTNNYFPIFNYILYVFALIFNNIGSISSHIYYIKVILVACDFGSIAICAWILHKFKISRLWSLLILFNPGFFYNSWIWGQIESLYIFFTIAALILAITKHPNWSIVLYILAFYSKLQAIVFLPGLLLLLLPQYLKEPQQILKSLGAFIITHVIILFPLIVSGQVAQMYTNVMLSVDLFPIVTVNAYNFWVLLFGGAIGSVKDATILFIFSYKTWGIILFCLASAAALWPLFWGFVKNPKRPLACTRENLFRIFLINALVALNFFLFPTQMHERYLQPAIILFGMAFLLKPNKHTGITFLVVSLTYALLLERMMRFLQLPEIAYQLMSSRIMSILFFAVFISGLILLYRHAHKLEYSHST